MLVADANITADCGGVGAADFNGGGLPDLVYGCPAPVVPYAPPFTLAPNAAVGAIYLNQSTATPFANVVPVKIPAGGVCQRLL